MYYRSLLRLSGSDIEDAHSDLVYAVTSSPRDWELWGEAMMFLIEAHTRIRMPKHLAGLRSLNPEGYAPDTLTLLRAIVSSR